MNSGRTPILQELQKGKGGDTLLWPTKDPRPEQKKSRVLLKKEG